MGAGGHSLEVCRRFPWIKIIGIDVDSEAAEIGRSNLLACGCQFDIKVSNFRHLAKVLEEEGIEKIDNGLFDLGMSSMQLAQSGRGFSFQKNEPILMTMKKDIKEGDLTAYEILRSWPKDSIEKILREYGEESFAGRIAEGIVKERKQGPINTTFDLVRVIENSTPRFYHHRRIHPATKTFQALRIAVNDEINSLKEGLVQAFDKLNVGGRIATISFHSLEDREVKVFFRELARQEKAILPFKKPLRPSFEETKINPKSRSSKLRVVQKILKI